MASSTLDGVTLDEALLTGAKEARDRLLELQHEADRARLDYHHLIRRLHAGGGSLREIAEALGLSHQRVHQIVDEGGGHDVVHVLPAPPFFPGPVPFQKLIKGRGPGPGFFERFGDDARDAIVRAQEEASALGHDYIGTEHLLLGLLGVEGRAAQALAALGVTPEAARADVAARVGEGEGLLPGGPRPFTKRAKRAVEKALREALAAGSDEIGTEHLLLALAARKGTAAEVLAALGADAERIRAQLDR